jgi:uncharacterized protein (DUF1330 family)
MADAKTHIDISAVVDKIRLAQPIVGDGPVVMLNLLRFRKVADYSRFPELAPPEPISGEDAYMRYLAAIEPRAKARGGDIVFLGKSGTFLLGPEDERWDMVLLARWPALKMLAASPSDPAYQAIGGHRTAALEDSRLLPMLQLR